ncbi:hypothetical protein BCR36DRAFT_414276 [Piromyces finnis]|uniref:Ras-GAP domain-containing protein n=1 Tax=Piromyces finnis TaxID=1754191 RepID=A0A1Y1V2P9_9FUNG|nr:hypothetical protein BCR36DRAFT_414276 [Piromyces finnis]|eukprot:ORX45964.1 hypothetical protein BCR36DRAFT_414276 [Piromyces finnis]
MNMHNIENFDYSNTYSKNSSFIKDIDDMIDKLNERRRKSTRIRNSREYTNSSMFLNKDYNNHSPKIYNSYKFENRNDYNSYRQKFHEYALKNKEQQRDTKNCRNHRIIKSNLSNNRNETNRKFSYDSKRNNSYYIDYDSTNFDYDNRYQCSPNYNISYSPLYNLKNINTEYDQDLYPIHLSEPNTISSDIYNNYNTNSNRDFNQNVNYTQRNAQNYEDYYTKSNSEDYRNIERNSAEMNNYPNNYNGSINMYINPYQYYHHRHEPYYTCNNNNPIPSYNYQNNNKYIPEKKYNQYNSSNTNDIRIDITAGDFNNYDPINNVIENKDIYNNIENGKRNINTMKDNIYNKINIENNYIRNNNSNFKTNSYNNKSNEKVFVSSEEFNTNELKKSMKKDYSSKIDNIIINDEIYKSKNFHENGNDNKTNSLETRDKHINSNNNEIISENNLYDINNKHDINKCDEIKQLNENINNMNNTNMHNDVYNNFTNNNLFGNKTNINFTNEKNSMILKNEYQVESKQNSFTLNEMNKFRNNEFKSTPTNKTSTECTNEINKNNINNKQEYDNEENTYKIHERVISELISDESSYIQKQKKDSSINISINKSENISSYEKNKSVKSNDDDNINYDCSVSPQYKYLNNFPDNNELYHTPKLNSSINISSKYSYNTPTNKNLSKNKNTSYKGLSYTIDNNTISCNDTPDINISNGINNTDISASIFNTPNVNTEKLPLYNNSNNNNNDNIFSISIKTNVKTEKENNNENEKSNNDNLKNDLMIKRSNELLSLNEDCDDIMIELKIPEDKNIDNHKIRSEENENKISINDDSINNQDLNKNISLDQFENKLQNDNKISYENLDEDFLFNEKNENNQNIEFHRINEIIDNKNDIEDNNPKYTINDDLYEKEQSNKLSKSEIMQDSYNTHNGEETSLLLDNSNYELETEKIDKENQPDTNFVPQTFKPKIIKDLTISEITTTEPLRLHDNHNKHHLHNTNINSKPNINNSLLYKLDNKKNSKGFSTSIKNKDNINSNLNILKNLFSSNLLINNTLNLKKENDPIDLNNNENEINSNISNKDSSDLLQEKRQEKLLNVDNQQNILNAFTKVNEFKNKIIAKKLILNVEEENMIKPLNTKEKPLTSTDILINKEQSKIIESPIRFEVKHQQRYKENINSNEINIKNDIPLKINTLNLNKFELLPEEKEKEELFLDSLEIITDILRSSLHNAQNEDWRIFEHKEFTIDHRLIVIKKLIILREKRINEIRSIKSCFDIDCNLNRCREIVKRILKNKKMEKYSVGEFGMTLLNLIRFYPQNFIPVILFKTYFTHTYGNYDNVSIFNNFSDKEKEIWDKLMSHFSKILKQDFAKSWSFDLSNILGWILTPRSFISPRDPISRNQISKDLDKINKTKYTEDITLELKELIFCRNIEMVFNLFNLCKNSEEIKINSKALLYAFVAESDPIYLMEEAIKFEIKNCDNINNVFMNETVASNLLNEFLRLEGKCYLESFVSIITKCLTKKNSLFEIDMYKEISKVKIKKGYKNFTILINELFERFKLIFKSIPLRINYLLQKIYKEINYKFQKGGDKIISKIIIKYFIGQALKNPKDYIKTYEVNIINNKEKILQSFKYLCHIFNCLTLNIPMEGKYKYFNKLSENYNLFTDNIQKELESIKSITFEEALLKNYTEYVINKITLDIIKKQLPESLQILHKYINHYYNEIQDYLINIPIDNIQIWIKIPNVRFTPIIR